MDIDSNYRLKKKRKKSIIYLDFGIGDGNEVKRIIKEKRLN